MMQDTTETKPKVSKMSGYISFNMVLCFVKKGGIAYSKEASERRRLYMEKA